MLAAEGFGLLKVTDVAPELLAHFSCGKPRLDSFLLESARDWHRRRLGFTHLVFHNDVDGPIGYFTLSHDSIPLNTSEQEEVEAETGLTSFPAVKLGRLAVQTGLQGKGIGSQILELAIGEAVQAESPSASRLMVVDADNEERVKAFYVKHGFQDSLWALRQLRHHGGRGTPAAVKMWLDLLTLG